jgi:hypothetical protein
VLIAVMKKVYDGARGNPGVRRMRAGLAALGHLVSHKRVHRLMQAAGLRGRHPKAWKRTTIGGDQPVPAPDLIGRDFTAALPDMRWCGDVTYIKTWDGWAYLATVIDLYSRKVVGWATAAHMRTSLVIAALDMAIAARKPPAGVIFHSDRGCQGGFNRSSQHLDSGGVDGQASGLDDGADGAFADEVAGCAGAPAGDRARVLAGDQERAAGGGSRGRCRRVAGGRCTVVPAPWRDALD